MKKQRAIGFLNRSKQELQSRFGVTRIALFGSTTRDVASSDSGVAILVDFDEAATSRRYFGVLFFLEELMGFLVDLVTEQILRSEAYPYAKRKRINVCGY